MNKKMKKKLIDDLLFEVGMEHRDLRGSYFKCIDVGYHKDLEYCGEPSLVEKIIKFNGNKGNPDTLQLLINKLNVGRELMVDVSNCDGWTVWDWGQEGAVENMYRSEIDELCVIPLNTKMRIDKFADKYIEWSNQ